MEMRGIWDYTPMESASGRVSIAASDPKLIVSAGSARSMGED